MNSNHTIVVTGATGQQGGATARHLLAQGWPVRVFVRDPNKPAAMELAAAGAEVSIGDFSSVESLVNAFYGAYGVYSMQPWRGPGGVEAERAWGLNVAEAAARTGIKHLVYSSVGGADRALQLAHFASKLAIEHRIAELDLPATILRPTSFMDNFRWQAAGIRAGKLFQGTKPTTRLQMIAVDDIGGIVALAFGEPREWIGRTLEIAGDELTMVEAAAVFAERLGRPVEFSSEYEQRPGGGDEARKMQNWFDEDGYHADIPALRALYPPLKDFRTFVAEATWLDE